LAGAAWPEGGAWGAALGRAHLKTGSLRDASGLAGYVLANSGRRYAFVAIVNHPNAGAARPVEILPAAQVVRIISHSAGERPRNKE